VSFGAFLRRKLPLKIASFLGKTGICPIIETVVFLGARISHLETIETMDF